MPEQKGNQTTYRFAALDSRTERGGRVNRMTAAAEYQRIAVPRGLFDPANMPP